MANLRRWALALSVMGLAALTACSNQGLGDDSDCDYLILAESGEEVAFDTLACSNTDLSLSYLARVVFRGPSEENGGVGNPPDPTSSSQFLLEHYDVTYRNLTTGGSVPGVDVPASIRVSVQEIFDLNEDDELEIDGFPVLRSGAKASPPLNNDAFYPTDAGVVFEATLTWWGHPVTDSDAWCYGTMHWVFTVIPC